MFTFLNLIILDAVILCNLIMLSLSRTITPEDKWVKIVSKKALAISSLSLLFSELFVASFIFNVMLLNNLTSSPNSSLLFSGIVLSYFPFAICLVASASNDIGWEILLLRKNEAATADNIARSSTSVKVIVYIIFRELRLYASVW